MNIILLSGGSGTRLWPLSNDIRSKQFIRLFKRDSCGESQDVVVYESMIEKMYRNIKDVVEDANITIATSASQVPAIRNQIGNDVGISVEPCRRDTFPAIALATLYLRDVLGISIDDAVVVCPVDPDVDREYFFALARLYQLAMDDSSNLTLMGVKPTYPSDKYGYIIPKDNTEISRVSVFKEKPDVKTAEEYIDQGALWNSGVFAYKIKYVVDIANKILGVNSYSELYDNYADAKKISFDYAVVEKENNISVMKFSGRWDDVGSWDALCDVMTEDTIGNVIQADSCVNTHVINELDIPVLCLGTKNMVVSASPQGILVSDVGESSGIKPYVESMNQRVMFAEKSWGAFQILDVSKHSLTIKVTLKSGEHMNYHSHEHRDEVWIVCSGKGRVVIDGSERMVSAGDVVTMKAGCKHIVFAETSMSMIEVQLGEDISIDDKVRHNMDSL